MTNTQLTANILINNYTLSELEDRFEMDTKVLLDDGFEGWVEDNYDSVQEKLREDLWLSEGM